MDSKVEQRLRRKRRIRARIQGTSERPRLTVYRSTKHIYAQVVNDDQHQTLLTLGTLSKELRDAVNLVSGAVKDLGDTLDDLLAKR